MQVELKLSGLNGVLETLKGLPPEVVSKNGGPVLRALRAGARLIIAEAKANLGRVTSNVGKDGKNHSTGLLVAKNLSAARKRLPGGERGEMVRIRVRRAIYPNANRIRGRKFATNDAAWFLEFGSEKQQAEPWLRPAFNARAEQATRKVETQLLAEIQRITKKLAQQNRGK